jgi:hypothetical protein
VYGGHFIGFDDEQGATAKPEWLNANDLGARESDLRMSAAATQATLELPSSHTRAS